MIRHLLIIGNYTFVFLVEKNSIQVTPPDELKGKYECAIRNFGCCSTGARCMVGSSTPSPTVRGARASTSSTSPSSLRKSADAPTSSSLTVEVMKILLSLFHLPCLLRLNSAAARPILSFVFELFFWLSSCSSEYSNIWLVGQISEPDYVG